MRQARVVPLPNEALYIEEIKFWLRIMQEHAGFIRGGLPPEAEDFCGATREFQRAFSSLLQKAERMKSIKQSEAFLKETAAVMDEFCRCQREILSQRLTGRMGGGNFPFFLDHLLREAVCFTRFLGRIREGKAAAKTVSHTQEIVVWLRFMADHARLFSHYIDPSECRIGKMTADFAALFGQLLQEGRDLSSMLYCQRGEVRAFYRFLLDARSDVQRLRDFYKMAEDLIADCRLLGVASAALAAHMKRETEHCLLRIALLEKELVKHVPDLFQDDADADVWIDNERADETAEAEDALPAAPQEQTAAAAEAAETETAACGDENCVRQEAGSSEEEQMEEPIVAILPLKPAADGKEAAAAAPSEELQDPASDAVAASPPPALPSAVPMQADKMDDASAAEKKEPPPQGLQKERIYAKASDYKYGPARSAGASPGERLLRQNKGRSLPRPLGKKNR